MCNGLEVVQSLACWRNGKKPSGQSEVSRRGHHPQRSEGRLPTVDGVPAVRGKGVACMT